MFTLSAFADEISPEPLEQIDVLRKCDIRHIEFRSILKTNVLLLTDHQIDEFKSLLDRSGFKLSAIGSPLGKIRIDEPFPPHLDKLDRAIELAKKYRTVHFHIKDWVRGEEHGRVAGEGQGRIAEVLADAVKRGYDGFATLEPHLLGGGPTGGVTGPELFPKAVEALRGIFREVGAQ